MLGRKHRICRKLFFDLDRDFVGDLDHIILADGLADNLVNLGTVKIIAHAEPVLAAGEIFPLGNGIGRIDRCAFSTLQDHDLLHLGDPAITDLLEPVTQHTGCINNRAPRLHVAHFEVIFRDMGDNGILNARNTSCLRGTAAKTQTKDQRSSKGTLTLLHL